jgi:NAD+ synthase (glutamine-hydrolysing)
MTNPADGECSKNLSTEERKMKKIDVLAVSLNLTSLDLSGNLHKIRKTFEFLHDQNLPGYPNPKAKCVVFPEFPLSGHVHDLFAAPWFRKRVVSETMRLLPETRGITAIFSLPLEINGRLHRAALTAVDGEAIGFVCDKEVPKSLARWFLPWKEGEQVTVSIEGKEYPAGDIFFDISGVLLGVAFDPFGKKALPPGIDILAIPGADPFELGRAPRRREALKRLSEQPGRAVIFANPTGNEAGQVIYDGESAVAESGHFLALERRFSYLDVSHLTATVDLDRVRSDHGDSLPPSPPPVIYRGTFDWGWYDERRYLPLDFYRESEPGKLPMEEWEKSGDLSFEEFPRAVAIGLYDYMRKSRSRGFVLSLSGGADSASVAALVSLMVWFGFTSLGKKRFLDSLSYIDGIDKLASLPPSKITAAKTVSYLLTTLYQQTANNSRITRDAARAVACETGSVHHEFDIEGLVQNYLKLGAEATGRPLDWKTDDLAMQNVQARARGPAAWLLANIRGALLLSPGNRSEAACGYTTMDGDTCGSISPIAGISKAYLRRWLHWLETTGPILSPSLSSEDGLGEKPFRVNFPSMKLINRQQPTAELRPLSEKQTDEGDLMPYTVLDIIERGMTIHRLFGPELLHFVQEELKEQPSLVGIEKNQLETWISKFESLFSQAQWKRGRLAPGFHLDAEDLSPNYYHLPILSAGFRTWEEKVS